MHDPLDGVIETTTCDPGAPFTPAVTVLAVLRLALAGAHWMPIENGSRDGNAAAP